jgi:TRAP-type C4-dicarboxylate transport system substrate-binding protein
MIKNRLLVGFMFMTVALVIGIALSGYAAQSSAPAEEIIKWKVQYSIPKGDPPSAFKGHYGYHALWSHGWADWIEEVTDGRLQIEMLEPDSAFPSSEALVTVGAGVVDAAFTQPGYWAGTMPEMYVVGGLPQSWDSIEEEYVGWYTYGIIDKIQPLYEKHNLMFFPLLAMLPMDIMGNFDIPNPESVKGRKIRTWGQWGEYYEMLGASTLTTPMADVYMGLKLGTVEAAFTGSSSLEFSKLKEVVTDFLDHPNPSVNALIINLDSLKALPEDIQEIIVERSEDQFLKASMLFTEQHFAVTQEAVKNYGLETWYWTDEEWATIRKDCIEKLWPPYAEKSPLCAELVEIVKRQLSDIGKY